MSALEAAGDENSAATAYQRLKSDMSEYLAKAREMNQEHWKLRDTTIKQAKTIALHDLSEFGINRVGEQAPGESHFHFQRECLEKCVKSFDQLKKI